MLSIRMYAGLKCYVSFLLAVGCVRLCLLCQDSRLRLTFQSRQYQRQCQPNAALCSGLFLGCLLLSSLRTSPAFVLTDSNEAICYTE